MEIAKNEFLDNIISKKFIIIILILFILSIWALVSGINYYNTWLNGYKDHDSIQQSWRWEAIDSLKKHISEAEANRDQTADIQALNEQLKLLSNPVMPSVVDVFQYTIPLFMIFGPIFGVAIGFDTLTKEKKRRDLKGLVIYARISG